MHSMMTLLWVEQWLRNTTNLHTDSSSHRMAYNRVFYYFHIDTIISMNFAINSLLCISNIFEINFYVLPPVPKLAHVSKKCVDKFSIEVLMNGNLSIVTIEHIVTYIGNRNNNDYSMILVNLSFYENVLSQKLFNLSIWSYIIKMHLLFCTLRSFIGSVQIPQVI